MDGNIDRNNDFDKGRLALELPGEMHDAFAEPAGFCRDLLASDHQGADFAGFGCTFMAKAAGNRDDGTRSIERDGRSWCRAKPSREPSNVFSAR